MTRRLRTESLLGLFLLGCPVAAACGADGNPSASTGGNAANTNQGAEAGDAASGSTGDGAHGGSQASAGAPTNGLAGAGGDGAGGDGSVSPPVGGLPLEDAWPEFRFRCQDLALVGDSLVVVQDEQRGMEHYRVVRLVELSTGHFRDGVGVDELVELQTGSRDHLHVAAFGNAIVVAGQHPGNDERNAYQLRLLDAETLEMKTRVTVQHNTHPDQIMLDAEHVYVAEDNAQVRRFKLPDLEEELTVGRYDSGITYATRVALDGDRVFHSASGLGQAQVARAVVDGGISSEWALGSQFIFRDHGDHYPWSILVAGGSLYVAGIARQGRAELMRFSADDGAVLIDQLVDGPFEGYDVHAAVNSSAFFYNRDHTELGDQLVRASLDDFQELVVAPGPRQPLALVADEAFIYVCSTSGLHRFNADTLELAGP
jgi:hypothetical protein